MPDDTAATHARRNGPVLPDKTHQITSVISLLHSAMLENYKIVCGFILTCHELSNSLELHYSLFQATFNWNRFHKRLSRIFDQTSHEKDKFLFY